jgi:hypothetical protein
MYHQKKIKTCKISEIFLRRKHNLKGSNVLSEYIIFFKIDYRIFHKAFYAFI